MALAPGSQPQQGALEAPADTVSGFAIGGTLMGATLQMPTAPQDAVHLTPIPTAGPPEASAGEPASMTSQQAPASSSGPPPAGPQLPLPQQRSPYIDLATYVGSPDSQLPMREDMHDGSGAPLEPWCQPELGEMILISEAKNTIFDGRGVVWVRRTSESAAQREGWILDSLLQHPAHAMTMTRVAAKVYELQSQDRDRIALVPGMQIVTFLPHGSSQPSSPSGRLLVSGVRKDGSPGDLDCFGFVVDSDLAPLVIPEQDGWPARTLSTSNNRDDMGILEETRMNGTSVSIPPVTYFQNGSEESERLKQRLMQLDQRKGDILAELESMPIIEGRIKAFETILAQLEQEIEGIKLEQQEMGSHLAPLSERMKALVMIQSPMEQELAHLRAEAYDNLGALFKLRYLLSRERHRAIDVAFQAEAKGQEADKLEVLEKRLDLLGSEQQEILRVKFNEQMLALQRKAQAEMRNLAELEPLADTLLARYAKIDNDGSALKTALEKENEKLEKIQAKIEAVETEIEANIATREVFEGIIADKHKDEHGDPFAPLVRWIRGDSRTSGPTPAPASAPVGVVPLTPLSGSPMSPFPPSAPLASAATGSVSSVPGEAAPWPGAPPAPMPAPYHVAAPVAPAVASGDRGSSDAGADWWDVGTVPSHTEISAPATVRLRMGSVGEPVAFPPRTAASADPTASAASAGSAISTASSGGDALARLRIAAADIEVNYERKLGEGGFGIVYEGLLKGATKVAIKTIKGDVSARTAAVFLKEVAVWNGLNQRNVLPLLAFCESPPIMVSELVVGGNLRDRLEELDWDFKAGTRFLQDVASGMSYLHSFNVLHGDLKSLNILIDRGDIAKITDFGLAKIREHVNRTSGSTGAMKGTLGFMAPELFDGEPIKPPADVYAFAMVCYEVVSGGKWPFEGLHQMAIIRKVCDKMERPERPPKAPDYVWDLMQRCWADDPLTRPTFPQIRAEMETWPN